MRRILFSRAVYATQSPGRRRVVWDPPTATNFRTPVSGGDRFRILRPNVTSGARLTALESMPLASYGSAPASLLNFAPDHEEMTPAGFQLG